MKECVLISRCLLGDKVRYDGGHCKQEDSLIDRLKDKYELISICPEVMAGMSTPRDPIELANGRVINSTGDDLTAQFTPVFEKLKSLIFERKISKAILKEFSPSCGSQKIYDGSFSGKIIDGQGIITAFLRENNINVVSEQEISQIL